MVADLAGGRRSAADLAGWLSPRIAGYHAGLTQREAPAKTPSPAQEVPMHGWLPNIRRTTRRKGSTMFRRFSPQTREVLITANKEAHALHHNYIGTEHLLLGLLHEREGVAGRTLHMLGISAETAREQVLDIIGEGSNSLPGTSRSRRGPSGSLRWLPGRPTISITSTWDPSTSCSAWYGRETGWAGTCSPASAPPSPGSATRSWSC